MSLLETLRADLGESRASDWLLIDQARVNAFAEATLDHQFIHTDPERAKAESPFGGPVAHGFLSLSLLSHFAQQVLPTPPAGAIGVNYGFEKVRFLAPVPVGARVRGRFTLTEVKPRQAGQIQLTQESVVEIEGAETPALIGHWLTLMVDARAAAA